MSARTIIALTTVAGDVRRGRCLRTMPRFHHEKNLSIPGSNGVMPAHPLAPPAGVSRDRRRSIAIRAPPRFHFRRRCLSLILPQAPLLVWITQQTSGCPSRELRLLLRCLMATSESSLSFVPRRVKATVSRRPPPGVPDRNGTVPPSGGFTTSYPRNVLLRVALPAENGVKTATSSVQRIDAHSRRVLEKLVSHSVDYVQVEQAAGTGRDNPEHDALEKEQVSVYNIPSIARWSSVFTIAPIFRPTIQWTIIVRTPSSSCAQALLAALSKHDYKAEMLSSEEQADHWRGVPEAIKNRARGGSERGAYALRKSRAAASQQQSRRR